MLPLTYGLQTALYNHVHNSPPLFPIPSQINPIHLFSPLSFQNYFNIILRFGKFYTKIFSTKIFRT